MSKRFFAILFFSSLLAGCFASDSDNNEENSRLTLSLTDGAVDFAEQVNLEVTGV